MGKITGFLEIDRQTHGDKAIAQRLKNFKEFAAPLSAARLRDQGARCMDCGIPYCHQGCPINNLIPDWNDLVYKNDWKIALEALHKTNNFPEFTGRICPAPCEEACTLNLIGEPVAIKDIECAIINKGWKEGWIKPQPPRRKSGKRVAVVGSGPAGLSCAQQLARQGHNVTLFEKNDRLGGLLRYGIPDFKMEKHLIDRRLEQMRGEGVVFKPNSHVGVNVKAAELVAAFDAVVLAAGAEQPRELKVGGSDADGIHFAMQYLEQQNRRGYGEKVGKNGSDITATDKNVVVIGGGDTGSDCIGTANRQRAASITQLEILSRPPNEENKLLTWPEWPLKMRTSSSQEEGCERSWAVSTERFITEAGRVTALELVEIDWQKDGNGKMIMKPKADSAFRLKADLVLLAMGFIHPYHSGAVQSLRLKLDGRGNVAANEDDYLTSRKKVFACGDMRRGQSLVVWAIREGRAAAASVDAFLRK